MRSPIYELGGAGPLMHIAVANGFPPQTYSPVFMSLTRQYRVISLPPRALWPGIGEPPSELGTWRDLADDLLNGLREHDHNDVIAVGHSFGAIVSMLAVLAEPKRFRGLCLLDPTVFPPPVMAMMQETRRRGDPIRIPLIEQALARRSHFADDQEAFDYWRGKGLFSDWSDEALWIYTRSMTRTANGGVELVWPPAWEAYYYSTIYADSWDDIPRLNALSLPILVIQGEVTNTFSTESLNVMRERLPGATYAVIPGHGHLFPHSAPDATRQCIEEWLMQNHLYRYRVS